jgi:hypothetical protein
MTYLLFAVALSLSAISAYYAVMGLIAIFAAAVVPIAIMGSLLEVSKLTVASWLYQNWKAIPKLLKTYFTIALVVLMLLTSMGIFGFLSKAHLDQAVPTGDVAAKLALIDEKIKTEKDNLNASRAELNQLDQAVNQTMSRTTEASGAERAVQIRRSQQKDRARILSEIGTTQTKIAKLQEERAPIASEVRKVEAEVGPIKYIAAIIYSENASEEVLEKAVRIVTLMIVFVLDPLAVLLLVAANWNMKHHRHEHWTAFFRKEKSEDFPEKTEIVSEEPKSVEEPVEVKENVEQAEDPMFTEKEHRTLAEAMESEIPEIEVDEHTKDWDPSLFNRPEVKKVGRYMAETNQKPPKVQSFLNNVQQLFTAPGVKVNTIEQEVSDLQKDNKNPK